MNKIIKLCLSCKNPIEEENLHLNYCIRCKAHNDKFNKLQSDKRKEKAYEIAKHHIEEYTKYNGKTLTPEGFNEVSPITAKKIIQSFRGKTWIDILRLFNKDNEFKEYIKEEYLYYLKDNKDGSFTDFLKIHKYITYQVVKSFGIKELLEYCEQKYYRNKNKDYEDNFINIKNNLGYIPLYSEFKILSKITLTNYAKRFNLKTEVYNNIVKMYSNDDEYNNYLTKQKEHKSKIGKQTCNIGKTLLTLEDLENEFKYIFNKCFIETGEYPSMKLFSKLSKHTDKTYREKLNMRWSEICKYYGYPTQQKISIFENYVLKHISNILNEIYEPQMKFDWLIGINNFPLFCDGYFPKHNLIVEVDGRQHRKPYSKFGGEEAFKTLQANDAVKNKLIPDNGILLLRIADNTNWHDVKYLKRRVEEVLNKKLINYKHCASL